MRQRKNDRWKIVYQGKVLEYFRYIVAANQFKDDNDSNYFGELELIKITPTSSSTKKVSHE